MWKDWEMWKNIPEIKWRLYKIESRFQIHDSFTPKAAIEGVL